MPEDAGGASPRHGRGEPGARPLILLTLAGDELPVTVHPTAHVSLQSFENAVLERLPHIGSNTTLGCELQFVQTNTLQILVDPTQYALSTNHQVLCDRSAMHGRGSTQGAAKRGSQGNPGAAW